ncbi:hypothetical protein [Candidatus Clostridium helianthi]|jgi:hypothetical protein|uniref:Uncharacterized protein n=1 Tax=Candidatus Clostridium helianthi TaxID=3381660 RepID=A0ABW8RZC8_9CLOT
MKVEEARSHGLDRLELDKFSEYVEMEERYKERREQDIVFAIMSEQVRIASELIGILDDTVISEITGISVNHLKCMRN